MNETNRRFYALLFFLAIIVNLSGIGLHFFTDDPALYAAVSKNLIYKHTFWQLYTYNRDWLDKPHFPFWMVYFSFKALGIHEWAYRLPALLFFLLSVLYTYLFSRKYYGREVAAMAVLILMTAQMTLMSNVDVRAEPYLMGLIIGSLYHIAQLDERFTIRDLLLASLLTACALMTKGLFVMIAIYGGLFIHLLMQKRLLQLFSFKWGGLVLLTALFVFPELYALYVQFDAHPEKLVFGMHHVSGVKWFLWDSQFSRFVNTGPITRKTGSVIFFIHTLLWAFAPWCLLFYFALCRTVRDIFTRRRLTEYYALGGAILLLLLFSFSRFQQPFYPNSIFPLLAIITAPYCCMQLNAFGAKYRVVSQWLYIILLPLAVILINLVSHPGNQLFFAIDAVVAIVLVVLIVRGVKSGRRKVFMLNCTIVLFVNFYLSTVFYPVMISYKGQITAAEYINQPQFASKHIYAIRMENNLFQYYTNRTIDLMQQEQFQSFKPTDSAVFFANQNAMDYLVQSHAQFKILKSFVDYPQENLLPAFINGNARNSTLRQVYLITK